MNQEHKTREFYNNYGSQEWDRLDKTAYDKLNYILHMDFVSMHLFKDAEVLDAGCGAGRFSIEFAKLGCNVSLLDISDEQLRLAESKIKEFGVEHRLRSSVRANITNMSIIEDDKYDVTVCYGAPLSYLYDNYSNGIKELYRVTKSGGKIVVSVNSRLGVIRMLLARENFNIKEFMERPNYWFINEVIDTGNLPDHPDVRQPPRHMFKSEELRRLFENVGFKNVKLASSPCVISGLRDKAEELYSNKVAWNTLIDIELKSYQNEHLADSGEFLMVSATK